MGGYNTEILTQATAIQYFEYKGVSAPPEPKIVDALSIPCTMLVKYAAFAIYFWNEV